MPKKKSQEGKPEVNEALDGLEYAIDHFGRINTNLSIDKLNQFLDENVTDKKFEGIDVERTQVGLEGELDLD